MSLSKKDVARLHELISTKPEVVIVSHHNPDGDAVGSSLSLFHFFSGIGCKVTIYDYEYDEELEFAIVGSTEANSLKGKISNESPLGSALHGAKKGDEVTVEMPNGMTSKYKVLKISKNN